MLCAPYRWTCLEDVTQYANKHLHIAMETTTAKLSRSFTHVKWSETCLGKLRRKNANENIEIIRLFYEVIRLFEVEYFVSSCKMSPTMVVVMTTATAVMMMSSSSRKKEIYIFINLQRRWRRRRREKNNDFRDKAITSCLIFTSKHSLDSHVPWCCSGDKSNAANNNNNTPKRKS